MKCETGKGRAPRSGGPLTKDEDVQSISKAGLSSHLLMMGHRISEQQSVPHDIQITPMGRRAVQISRAFYYQSLVRFFNFGAPALWCMVLFWLLGQRTMEGLYRSVSDASMSFSLLYSFVFITTQKALLLQRIQEAAAIAKDIEDVLEPEMEQVPDFPSLSVQRDVRRTVNLLEFIYGAAAVHVCIVGVTFFVPTMLTGESPSPIVSRSLPLYGRVLAHLYQDVTVTIGDFFLVLSEYIHIGTTLSACLMYRMLAARFEHGSAMSAEQLKHLAHIHCRLINNTDSLQNMFGVTVLLTLGGVIIGLVTSTIGILVRSSTTYFLTSLMYFMTSVVIIMIQNAIGDELLTWSRNLADKVYCCHWVGKPRTFCTTVALMITRAQRPQVVFARYVGALDRPTGRDIFNRWYTFVQVLQNTIK